jgi:hypothetical protein
MLWGKGNRVRRETEAREGNVPVGEPIAREYFVRRFDGTSPEATSGGVEMLAVLEWTDFAIIAVLILLLGHGSRQGIGCSIDERRLRRVERKVDAIIQHLGIALPDYFASLSPGVRRLADQGSRIGAVKAYRKQTGASLREAKDLIDDYLDRPGRTAP